MTNRHTARRAKTDEKIKEAFQALLQEKPYADITVREIAERANIGFKTLYRHYDDKDVIANVVYEEVWHEIVGKVAELGLTAEPEVAIGNLLQILEENNLVAMTFVLMGSEQSIFPDFVKSFSRMQVQVYRPDLFENTSKHLLGVQSAVVNQFMAGQFALVRWWLLENDMQMPRVTMATLIAQLVVHPILNMKIPPVAE